MSARYLFFLTIVVSIIASAVSDPIIEWIKPIAKNVDKPIIDSDTEEILAINPKLTFVGQYANKRYYLEPNMETWRQANFTCVNDGMNLVAIGSADEKDALYGMTSPTIFWTSGIDVGTPTQLHWETDNSAITVPLYGGVMRNTAVVFDSRTAAEVPLTSNKIYTLPMDELHLPLCQIIAI